MTPASPCPSLPGTTADGLWNLPRGVAAVPDVSCVTSFSSEVVRSSRALSRAMDASLSVSGGGWGVKFSASASYQQAASEVASGEHLLVISAANCNYYFVKLISSAAPPFHSGFIRWLIKLNNTQDQNDFIDFFQEYGTHYVTEALFGASFVYEHKMSASNYEKLTSSGYDVAVSASYSGVLDVSGKASYSQQLNASVAAFRNSVQTTTITVGSPPPANGDALKWASTVQQYPIPVKRRVFSMEGLFSSVFMGAGSSVESLSLDYKRLKTTIMATKRSYCMRLQSQGLVNDCSDYISGLTLDDTQLTGRSRRYGNIRTSSACVDLCYVMANCQAVDYCDDCTSGDSDYKVCRVYTATQVTAGRYDTKWQTIIPLPDLPGPMRLSGTGVHGVTRALTFDSNIDTEYLCSLQCAADEFCVAFTFCQCPERKSRCKLYSDTLYYLTAKSDSTLYFLPPGQTLPKPPPFFTLNNRTWAGPYCLRDNVICKRGACFKHCLCPVGWYYSVTMDQCIQSCSRVSDTMMGPYEEPRTFPDLLRHPQTVIQKQTTATPQDCIHLCLQLANCQGAAVIDHHIPNCYLLRTIKGLGYVPFHFGKYYQRACVDT